MRAERKSGTNGRVVLLGGTAAARPRAPQLQRWRLAFAQVVAADSLAMLYVAGGANAGTGR